MRFLVRLRAAAAACAAAVIACSAGSSTGAPDGAAADANARGGDEASAGNGPAGIYRACAGGPLTLSVSSTHGYSLEYPGTWKVGPLGGNYQSLTRGYTYLPTGASSPTSAIADVTAYWGTTATSASDVQRNLDDMVNGLPKAVVRRFTIGGHPAIAWWDDMPPPQAGCQGCPVDPGPDFIQIGVGAANGLAILKVIGSARVNAPENIFCDMQAIEASLALH